MPTLPTHDGALATGRTPWLRMLMASGMALLTLATAVPSFAQTIDEFPITTGGSAPVTIISGPDGALWFTMEGSGGGGGRIVRITTDGAITDFVVPTLNGVPFGITVGSDGALWFTEYQGNKIGRLTTAGVFTEFDIPTPNSGPHGIAAAPDGDIWFTETNSRKIGRLSAGQVTEFIVGDFPSRIVLGPDGNMWFTLTGEDKIGRITLAGVVTTFPVPPGSGGPSGITAHGGVLWVNAANIL